MRPFLVGTGSAGSDSAGDGATGAGGVYGVGCASEDAYPVMDGRAAGAENGLEYCGGTECGGICCAGVCCGGICTGAGGGAYGAGCCGWDGPPELIGKAYGHNADSPDMATPSTRRPSPTR